MPRRLPKVKMPIGTDYASLPDWKPKTPRLKGYPQRLPRNQSNSNRVYSADSLRARFTIAIAQPGQIAS